MPVTSRAQFRFWYAQYNKGKISKKKLKEWVGNVSYHNLPERIRATHNETRKKRRRR